MYYTDRKFLLTFTYQTACHFFQTNLVLLYLALGGILLFPVLSIHCKKRNLRDYYIILSVPKEEKAVHHGQQQQQQPQQQQQHSTNNNHGVLLPKEEVYWTRSAGLLVPGFSYIYGARKYIEDYALFAIVAIGSPPPLLAIKGKYCNGLSYGHVEETKRQGDVRRQLTPETNIKRLVMWHDCLPSLLSDGTMGTNEVK